MIVEDPFILTYPHLPDRHMLHRAFIYLFFSFVYLSSDPCNVSHKRQDSLFDFPHGRFGKPAVHRVSFIEQSYVSGVGGRQRLVSVVDRSFKRNVSLNECVTWKTFHGIGLSLVLILFSIFLIVNKSTKPHCRLVNSTSARHTVAAQYQIRSSNRMHLLWSEWHRWLP